MKFGNYLQIAILGCIVSFLNIKNSSSATKFIAERSCPIYKFSDQIKDSDKKVGNLDLNKNYNFQSYKNFRNKEYILIIEDTKENEPLLVSKNCGYNLFDTYKKFEPIFDHEELKYLDKISQFDQEILKLCAAFGSHPKKEEFISLISKNDFASEFNILYNKLNKSIITPQAEKNIFIEELADLLFKNWGFNHIFCGIRKDKKLAGPHYYPRFLDLQKNNYIGKNSSDKCEILPIYSNIANYSIDFLDQSGKVSSKCQNSFIKNLNGWELISMGALSAKINDNHLESESSNKNTSCLYKYDTNNQNILFKIVHHKKNKSLVTLYPVEKDKCLDIKDDQDKCFCNVKL